jgi:proline iminopeptidase
VSDVEEGSRPRDQGLLHVGDGQRVWWAEYGNPDGVPLVVVHGGPGGGSLPAMRAPYDDGRFRIVMFDQRGCGRSTPHAGDLAACLAVNTTAHLVSDMEALRDARGIDRWVAAGSSWGVTLSLTYAQAHPARVLGMILRSVTTYSASELAWVYRDGASHLLPERWEEFTAGVPAGERDDLVAAYHRRVGSPDANVRVAAALGWCRWETAGMLSAPDPAVEAIFAEPRFAVAFARISTHYALHHGFVEDGSLVAGAAALVGIPAVIIQGRRDLCTPPVTAWRLHRAWPGSRLHLLEDEGHRLTGAAATLRAAAAEMAALA